MGTCKKVLSYLLILTLVFGCFAGTGITVKAAAIFSASADKTELESSGGTVTVTIKGEELSTVYWRLRKKEKGDLPVWNVVTGYEKQTTEATDIENASIEVKIPANTDTEKANYRIELTGDEAETSTWSGVSKIAITVAASSGEVVEADKTALQTAIEKAELETEEGYTQTSWKALVDELAKAREIMEDNKVSQDEVDAAVKALEEAIDGLTILAKVTSLKASPAKIPGDGGTVELQIEGENLTKDNWGIITETYISGTGIAVSKAGEVTVVEQDENGATLEISATGMKNDVDFKIRAGAKDGSEIKPECVATVVQEKKNYDTITLEPETVVMADESTIVATFNTSLEAAKEGEALNKLFTLEKLDNIQKLTAEDKVTVEEEKVIVKFSEPLGNLGKTTNLRIKEGALREKESGNILTELSWLVTTDPTVSSISLDKDILDSKGGTVTATLNGFKVAEVQDEKIEAEVYVPGTTTATTIEVKKGRDGENKPTLTFDVPENATENTISYWLGVKYEGVVVYESSASGVRGQRTTISVLPEGKTASDQTLGGLTISGSNKTDVSDSTDIEVSVSSAIGELKTELRLYGTNLDPELTKVRAIDENGIIFPVYDIAECDGTIRFVAVAGVHKNGVFGEGNSQLIEVLPPRYVGTNKTYTIQVAIDGKNFIDVPSVKLTVKNENLKNDPEFVECSDKDFKYVNVKYVEKGTGKQLAPADQYKGYSVSMLRQFDIAPKTIAGYRLVKSPAMHEFIGDGGRTYTYEYQSTKPAPVKVKSLKIKGSSKKIAAGKKIQLTASVAPSNAANKAVTWKVSNRKYAYVSKSGKVLLKKAGAGKTVTVTATAKDGSGKKATYKIKIMKNRVKSIKLKSSKTLKAGKKLRVKATVRTTGRKANKTLKWYVSNKKYAVVSSKGTVKAYKAGKGKTVKITAKATDGSGVKKTIKIKIK